MASKGARAGSRGKNRAPRRRERTGLTRERLVEAGLALAERDGIEALTLRRLADELGSRPMSLYTYIADKEELLDAMFVALVRQIAASVTGESWQQLLTNLARGIVEVFTTNSKLLPLAVRFADTTPLLPALERLLVAMRRDGFGPERALVAFHMIVSLALGVVMLINSDPAAGPVSSSTRLRVMLAQLPAELVPTTPELPDALIESRALLDAGLALLIAGLEHSSVG